MPYDPSFEKIPGFVNPHGYTKEQALLSVGPGWAGLINALWDYIQVMRESNETQIVIEQVKEKWGLLRVYGHGTGKFGGDIYAFIQGLEYASRYICESCGKPGSIRHDRPWVITSCNACLSNTELHEKESRKG